MAILIEKNVTILGMFDVSTLYLRFNVNHLAGGNKLELKTSVYPSRTSYDAGINQCVRINGINDSAIFDYNRVDDGGDVLLAAHNKLKTLLSTDVMQEITPIDASSYFEIISPKFAQDSSISFIDID